MLNKRPPGQLLIFRPPPLFIYKPCKSKDSPVNLLKWSNNMQFMIYCLFSLCFEIPLFFVFDVYVSLLTCISPPPPPRLSEFSEIPHPVYFNPSPLFYFIPPSFAPQSTAIKSSMEHNLYVIVARRANFTFW